MPDPGTELAKSALDVSKAAIPVIDRILNYFFKKSTIKNEPIRIREKAKAKAYAMKTITKAKVECYEMVEGAKNRNAMMENQRQDNLQAIGEKTKAFLEKDAEIKVDEKSKKDWYFRYIENAQDVSDEDVQNIWAKVLAGEITKKCSFSLRTLDVLRNISRNEAEIFQKLSSRVIQENGSSICFIFNLTSNYLKAIGIGAAEQMILRECGLLNPTEVTSVGIKSDGVSYFTNNGLDFSMKSQFYYTIPIYTLTIAGAELLKIMDLKPDVAYIKAFVAEHENQNFHICVNWPQ